MYKTCKDLEYFFEGIKLGDVIAAYNRITRVYNRQTTAGFIASQKAFTSSSMAQDHVDLCQFIALIAGRAKRVRSLGGTVSEKEKISVLLGGLLPEFKAQKTLIQKEPINTLTYEAVGNDLTDFAISEEIYSLKAGGTKGASKTYNVHGHEALNKSQSHSCRNWERDGTCRYGDNCKFEHRGPGGIAETRKARISKGGGKGGKVGDKGCKPETCDYCSKKGHSEGECFAKKNQPCCCL